MARNLATETILGGTIADIYKEATLTLEDGTVVLNPDGTPKKLLMQRAKTQDGKEILEVVDEKLAAFNEASKDTRFPASDWKPPTTSALSQKAIFESKTARDLQGILILTFGDPKAIITAKALDATRIKQLKNTHSLTIAWHVLKTLNHPEWNEASKYIPAPPMPI